MLHQSVLARVIGDDDERAAVLETIAQRGERACQSRQLVVDGDAHRLEQTRELGRSGTRTICAANRADEVVARLEWTCPAPADDLARQPCGARLVAVLAEDASEL